MVTIYKELMLGKNEGSSQKATGKVAIAHSTATPNASAKNLATYEKRTWQNAYVHYGVDDIGAWAVGQEGYQAWGAMQTANSLSPLQVELCEFDDRTRALKAYANYVKLLHDRCVALGIPLTLDDNSSTGIKTHAWVSQHWEGDHTDPYGYLKKIGISKEQFAADLKTGQAKSAPAPSEPAPAPSKPSTGKSIAQLAQEVIAGKYGTGAQRQAALGSQYAAVQAEVNRQLGQGGAPSKPGKSINQLAQEVIAGKYGSGEARKKALGGQYNAVQAEVNRILGAGGAAPKPAGVIKQGSAVRFVNPIDEHGTHLGVSGTYTVMELRGSRAVVGRNGAVTAATNVSNLRLA